MDEKFVSYLAFESATSRQERTIKRLWILIIILIVSLLGTNAGWIYYESQFEAVVVTQDVQAESGGSSNLSLNAIGGDYYGSESKNKTDN